MQPFKEKKLEKNTSLVNMKKLIHVAILLFCFFGSFSQSKKIDSVLHVIAQTKQDTSLFKLYSFLENNVSSSEEVSVYSDSCLSIALRLNISKYLAIAYTQKGSYFFARGDIKKSLLNHLKAFDIAKRENNKLIMSKCLNNIANSYDVMGIYDKALSCYFQSLKLKQELNLVDKIYMAKLNIAIVYYNLKEYKKAIAYIEEGLPDCIKYNDEYRLAMAYSNLGNVYADMKEYEKSASFYEKAITIAKKTEDYSQYTNSIMGLANNMYLTKRYLKAIEYADTALKIAEENNFSEYVAGSKNELGENYVELKKYDLAEKNLLEALSMAKENEIALEIKSSYEILSRLYVRTNKLDKALAYYQLYSAVKDSLINDNKSQLLANLQENYEIEKRETENKLLQTQNELSGKTIKQQKITNYFIVGGLVLSLLFGFFIFRGLKAQRKANVLISKQKEEVHRQKEIVEEKQKEIIDSITYAKRIQTALLTSDRYIEKTLNRLNPKD